MFKDVMTPLSDASDAGLFDTSFDFIAVDDCKFQVKCKIMSFFLPASFFSMRV